MAEEKMTLDEVVLKINGIAADAKKATEAAAAIKVLEEKLDGNAVDAGKLKDLGVALDEIKSRADKLEADMKKGLKKDGDKIGFRALMGKAIEESGDQIKSFSQGGTKGALVIPVKKDMSYLQNFEDHDYFTADVRPTVIQPPVDPFQARQIISVGSTTGDVLHYPKLVGKIGTGPDSWAYGTGDGGSTVAKPEFSPEFEPYTAPVEWIAGIIRVPVQMLQDLSWLTSFLQTWGLRQLADKETDQVFNGNGSSPQLTGILDVAPVYAGTYSNPIEVLVDASLGTLGSQNFVATHIVLNPVDIVPIILNKAQSTGVYNLPEGVIGVVNGRLTINGITVVVTNKMAAGTWLLGDFRQVQIVQRIAPQLRFFEQDVDNVQKNMITIRVEERIALPIFADEAFVQGSFATT